MKKLLQSLINLFMKNGFKISKTFNKPKTSSVSIPLIFKVPAESDVTFPDIPLELFSDDETQTMFDAAWERRSKRWLMRVELAEHLALIRETVLKSDVSVDDIQKSLEKFKKYEL